MIAAPALVAAIAAIAAAAHPQVHRATLVIRNAADFRDVPGLDLVVW
jgi:predicted nucleic acid-binding protein